MAHVTDAAPIPATGCVISAFFAELAFLADPARGVANKPLCATVYLAIASRHIGASVAGLRCICAKVFAHVVDVVLIVPIVHVGRKTVGANAIIFDRNWLV